MRKAAAKPSAQFFARPEVPPVLHPDLLVSKDWIISVRRLEARTDEECFQTFDLKQFVLPPNFLSSKPTQLIDQPRLALVVVLLVEECLRRSKPSKSRTQMIRTFVREAVCVLEFLWLRDVLDLQAATPKDFEELLTKFHSGGWGEVLELEARFAKLDASVQESLTRTGPCHELPMKFRRELSTNLVTASTFLMRSEPQEPSPQRRMAASSLKGFMGRINYMFDIGTENGLNFVPYPNAFRLSNKLGRASGRTANLQLDCAVALLKEAHRWIYTFGPVVTELLEEVCTQAEQCHSFDRKYLGKALAEQFDCSQVRLRANAVLPFPIEHLDLGRGEKRLRSLRSALLCVMSAAFVCIASMNGRRKDEIVHPKYGLRRGDLKLVSAELELFESIFYIEKTYRKRVPYYVNQLTADSIMLLERIENSFFKLDVALLGKGVARTVPREDERSLFSYRRLSAMSGVGAVRNWYDFTASARDSNAADFLELALGEKGDVPIRAHMFRRMYALIFFYQYENGELVSLSNHLGHFDLASTLIYVTDPAIRAEYERIHALFADSAERREIHADHRAEVQENLREVGEEKLRADIKGVIGGGAYAGGYAKLIKKIKGRLANATKFSATPSAGQAIFAIAKQRGHFPKPMRHGQCMTGGTMNVRAARCYSKEKQQLCREEASVATCSKCIFHLTSAPYLENAKADLIARRRELAEFSPGSLMAARLELEIDNLSRAIALSFARLSQISEQAT